MSRRNFASARLCAQRPTGIGSMPRMVTHFLFYALVLLLRMPLVAQDATFEAVVDRNQVGLGEQFTLSFVLGNAGMGGGKNLQLPDLGKFHIMGGPNQSSNMQFVNGVVSSSITYSYILQPKEMGKFTIGSASIEASGKIYKTQPLTIEVVKGSARPQPQANNQADDIGRQIGDNLFLRAVVDKSRVLQGEQINLTFKLYTRVSVANYSIAKNPTLSGFWSEDIENPKNISLANETVNGKQYRVGVIRRMALFPTQSGTLEISPIEVQTVVQIQSRRSLDPFDAFFRDPFGQNVNYEVKSDPIKVKVDPLPPGAPASFKGAVGRFTMNTKVDKQTTKTNEPISLKIVIAGTGNIKILESPVVELPTDFEQYTPKVSDNISRQQEKISGSKTFEYLLIPRYPGRKNIKPVTFSYFDVGKKDYVTLTSSSIELNVEQGAAQLPPLVSGGLKEDVQLLNQDIRFIKITDSRLVAKGNHVFSSTLFIVLLLLPVAGFAGAFVYGRQRQAVMADEVGFRNRKALKIAQKGLKSAEQMLQTSTGSDQKLKFYSEVARAMWKYLGDKLNIPPAEMSIEGATTQLAGRSVPGEVLSQLKALLESCEMARFAPTSLETGAMQKAYDEAKRVIVELERTLKS